MKKLTALALLLAAITLTAQSNSEVVSVDSVKIRQDSPAIIVQNQVEAFNKEDLNAFAACFSEDVTVLNYPSDTLYTGNVKLKSGYERFFANNPKTTVEVVTRIQKKNVVIDEERVIMDGKEYRQAAIYEVKKRQYYQYGLCSPKKPFFGSRKCCRTTVTSIQCQGYR